MNDSVSESDRLKTLFRKRLAYPRAVLAQLKETQLFNSYLDDALREMDELFMALDETAKTGPRGGRGLFSKECATPK